MAKFNGNKNNNKKRPEKNYFTQQKAALGEDFYTRMLPADINRDAPRMLREIIKGKVNFTNNYDCLIHPPIINAILNESYAQMNETGILANAMNQYITNKTNSGIMTYELDIRIRNKYNNAYEIYKQVSGYLLSFRDSQDVNVLISMASYTNKVRNFVKEM